MNGPLSLGQRLVLAKYLADALAALRRDELVPAAADEWVPGERQSVKFGGRQAGWVSLPKPVTTARVTDEAKLLAWCEQHAPGAIRDNDEVIVDQALIGWLKEHRPQSVRTRREVDGYVTDAILAGLKRDGRYVTVNGDIHGEVPGVTVSEGEPSPRVNLEPDAHAVIADAWRSGGIPLADLLALPGRGEAA